MMLETNKSKLIDMRDFQSKSFKGIYEEMLQIHQRFQPAWLRLMLKTETLRSRLRHRIELVGTRRWEYAWGILSADLEDGLRVLDAGCGGSPFLIYLAKREYECFGIDPGKE